ncbi:hypothetical protein CAEBREN_05490 [Caenorhabditis brenneri]|uniref:DUF38 domain-containing protein n=1 Tax=Caenorhabditis brenneri TaxID=135651 RepID=G0P658_CAEBE|nr:hypothetical protein CAEBREN_05490 [Caenorhabditis brenneri]
METLSLYDRKCLKVLANPVLMKNVAEWLNLIDIQRLRKVCVGIRECIDTVKPDPHIKTIVVDAVNLDQIDLSFRVKNGWIRLEYRAYWGGCHVRFNGGYAKAVPGEDFLSRCMKDFEICTKNQKGILNEFRILFSYTLHIRDNPNPARADREAMKKLTNKLLEMLRETLSSRKSLLKVEHLNIQSPDQDGVMAVLPFMDPDFLERIEIEQVYFERHRNSMLFDKIANLEQWKRAETLKLSRILLVGTPIQEMNLFNFKEVDLKMNSISEEDVVYIKNKLLNCSNFEEFKIRFHRFPITDPLLSTLGPSYYNRDDYFFDQRKMWFFGTQNQDRVLQLLFITSQSFIFSSLNIQLVPDDAVIL